MNTLLIVGALLLAAGVVGMAWIVVDELAERGLLP